MKNTILILVVVAVVAIIQLKISIYSYNNNYDRIKSVVMTEMVKTIFDWTDVCEDKSNFTFTLHKKVLSFTCQDFKSHLTK